LGEAPNVYYEFWVQNCEVFDDYVWIDGVHVAATSAIASR
jgi:hypothetical protein